MSKRAEKLSQRLGVFGCAYCGSKESLTVDHVVPKCRGGDDAKSNLLPACSTCNSIKARKTLDEWRSSAELEWLVSAAMGAALNRASRDCGRGMISQDDLQVFGKALEEAIKTVRGGLPKKLFRMDCHE